MFGNLHAQKATIKYKITYNGFFVMTAGVNDGVAARHIGEHVDKYGIEVQETATIKPLLLRTVKKLKADEVGKDK